jgi:hypothetical protein
MESTWPPGLYIITNLFCKRGEALKVRPFPFTIVENIGYIALVVRIWKEAVMA